MKQFVIYILLFLTIGAQGIDNNSSNFFNLSVRDGLPHGWVKAITQDAQGFVWFGTNDGLCKYDGKSFKTYRYEQGNNNSLWSNIINCVYTDSWGNLWIGTSNGLNYYDLTSDKISRISDVSFNASGIFQADSNTFLIGSYSGVYTYTLDSRILQKYTINDELSFDKKNRFRVIIPYKDNALLFAEGGCYQFNYTDKTFTLLFADGNDFQGENARSALVHDNILWIGSRDSGIDYVNLDSITVPISYGHSYINKETVSSLYSVNENELIVSCENKGIAYIDTKNLPDSKINRILINQTNSPFGLINNTINSIYKDKQENLWFGTYNGVSYQYNNGKGFNSLISNARNSNSLANDMVNSLLEVGDNLWVGTEKGIDIFDKQMKRIKRIRSNAEGRNSLLSSAIITMELADDGNVWAGSWSGGVDIINPRGEIITQITKNMGDQSISHNSIMSIKKDREGNMWIGSMGGGVDVFMKKEQRFVHYKSDPDISNSLCNNWVLSFLVSSQNEIWISTHAGVDLFNIETKQFHHFAHQESDKKSIAGTGIDCMLEDKNGKLWFGSPSGLSVFNRSDSTFTNFYKKDGLPNSNIQSILYDDNNHLWIGTNNGLAKMIYDDTRKKSQLTTYSIGDGLIANEFIRRACYKREGGDLYFGTKNGLVYFNPQHIVRNDYVPEVFFTSLQINNQEITVNDETDILQKNICLNPDITLNYNQSDISISFSAINYVVPDKNRYKYKLHGFDDEWINLGKETKATYTNIPYGDYEFQVKASNNSDLWNEKGAKLNIQITPPWYRTKLAYVLFFTIVLLLILSYRFFIMTQANLRSKLKLEIVEKENLNRISQMKNKFFTNISHEFLTPLSLILGPLESISTNTEDESNYLQKKIIPVYRNARRLQRLINQLLDISKIEANHLKLEVSEGDIHTFIDDIFIGFKNFATQMGIVFKFNSSLQHEWVFFDSDKIEKIIYNLLSNALKFTPAGGSVTLSLCFDEKYLNIKVEDSGIGIDLQERELIFDGFYQSNHGKDSNFSGAGVGLNLIRGLVNIYGGTIELESEKGKGSSFIINLPYRREDFSTTAISTEKTEIEPLIEVEEYSLEENVFDENPMNENLKTILVVEDNKELNGHIVEVLSSRFNVTSAFNGEQGINVAKEIIPDLIIADWVMPKIDGLEMLILLRDNESTSHIPIIVLTAKIDDESKITGLQQGADAYITKPFEHRHLITTIDNLLKTRENLKNIFKKNIVIEPSQVAITSVDEKFITKAIKLVEENFSNEEFSVELMATEIGMSRAQLHRKITGLLGMSTSSFIRDIKIIKAAELLTVGQLRVSEVMYEVNFKSRNYFTKCFKEKFSLLPMEYVKQYKLEKKADL